MFETQLVMHRRNRMLIKEVKVHSEIISSYVVLAAILITCLAYAQSTPPAERIKTIFDYKQELNLTDRQEQDIKTILTDLNKEVRITRAETYAHRSRNKRPD